jgi:hypothetical protein
MKLEIVVLKKLQMENKIDKMKNTKMETGKESERERERERERGRIFCIQRYNILLKY